VTAGASGVFGRIVSALGFYGRRAELLSTMCRGLHRRAEVKARPFGTKLPAGTMGGLARVLVRLGTWRACMATLELRILRRFAWSCG